MSGRTFKSLSLLSFIFLVSFSTRLMGQELNSEDMMKYQMMINTPGEQHAMLNGMVGEWDQAIYVPMGEGMEPMKINGVSKNGMILGGRFLLMNSVGEAMGQKTEAMSVIGFDKRKNVFTMDGYDTMGTYAIHSSGNYDAESKTITFHGVEEDPNMPAPLRYRFTVTFESEDKVLSELWFMNDEKGQDKEVMAVKVVNTRKK